MRRVLKAGGQALFVTNAADHSERLMALHEQSARQLGYVATPRVGLRFNLDHLSLVRDVFPDAQRFVRPDAFVFPDVEPALRYYGSGMVDALVDPPADASHRPRLLELVGGQIEAIIRREGVFRVQKDAGCFVARAPQSSE
jgi:hypothetical protein